MRLHHASRVTFPQRHAAPAPEQEVSDVDSDTTEEAAVRQARPPRLAQFQARVVDGDGMEPANLIRLDKGWAVAFTWSPENTTLLVPGCEWEPGVVGRPIGEAACCPSSRSLDGCPCTLGGRPTATRWTSPPG